MPAIPIIAAVSGASAAIGAGAAAAIGLGTVGTVAATAIGTGIIAGGMTAVQGGDVSDVLESAVVGGVTSFVGGSVAGAVGNVVAETTGSQIAASAAANAARTLVTGGDTEDVLTSGLLGGVGAGINQLEKDLRQEEFDSQMTESGLAGQTAVDDTTATVLQPYEQAQSIDQLLQEIQANQTSPMPMEDVSAPAPVDNSAALAALGVAKTVAPIAINALAANAAMPEEQQSTGFEIVPVPSDWTSPVYSQQFMPSAPVDFGSTDLLQGTQWGQQAKPMGISALMNVLNSQSNFDQPIGNLNDVPVSINDIIANIGKEQYAPFDMNQQIGQMDGSPVSLASIIAGIQSQYG
jgi:hypothetical protein